MLVKVFVVVEGNWAVLRGQRLRLSGEGNATFYKFVCAQLMEFVEIDLVDLRLFGGPWQ